MLVLKGLVILHGIVQLQISPKLCMSLLWTQFLLLPISCIFFHLFFDTQGWSSTKSPASSNSFVNALFNLSLRKSCLSFEIPACLETLFLGPLCCLSLFHKSIQFHVPCHHSLSLCPSMLQTSIVPRHLPSLTKQRSCSLSLFLTLLLC